MASEVARFNASSAAASAACASSTALAASRLSPFRCSVYPTSSFNRALVERR